MERRRQHFRAERERTRQEREQQQQPSQGPSKPTREILGPPVMAPR
jgi:hypothetical protein